MAEGSEGFVLCLNCGYLTLLVLIKLNWKFKMVNAINDCVAYRCSHLRAYAGLRFGSSLRTFHASLE